MSRFISIGLLAAGFLVGEAALADHRQETSHGQRHVDTRYGHNHAYANFGVRVRAVPRGAMSLSYGSGRYWFNGGVWYRHRGADFVVVAPPIGIIVSVLPPFYTTLMIGGMPYYYANNTYYTWNDSDRGYQVVEAPPSADAAQVVSPATAAAGGAPTGSESVFIYPKNGQSAEQQDKDRYECHRWAADQTHFDPTRTTVELTPDAAEAQRADYFRAMNACLDGRGYTVR